MDTWLTIFSTLSRFMLGWWVNFEEIDYDYSKYLGKDWR